MNLRSLLVFISALLVATFVHATPPPTNNPEPKPAPAKTINLNTADAATLATAVKGIGLKRAQSIVKYREANHGFKSIDELGDVPGIGKNFVVKHHSELEQTFSLK